MFMFPGRIPAVEGSTQSGQTYYFTYKDYLAIRKEAQFVGALSPVLNREDIRDVLVLGREHDGVFKGYVGLTAWRIPTNEGRRRMNHLAISLVLAHSPAKSATRERPLPGWLPSTPTACLLSCATTDNRNL